MSDTLAAIPKMTVKGTSGEVRHGYQVAGRFAEWSLITEWTQDTLNKGDASTSCIVTVSGLEPDAYWFDQQPHSVRLHLGSRTWAWREIEWLDSARFRVKGDPEN